MSTSESPETPASHRELYDEDYAAEQARLGRRRVMFITLISTTVVVLILAIFILREMVYGTTLTVRRNDRLSLVTATTVSDMGHSITISLDAEKVRKHRDRYKQVFLNYEYLDGDLEILSRIEVRHDEELASNEFAEQRDKAFAEFRESGWGFIPLNLPLGEVRGQCTYGTLVIEGEKNGHYFIARVGNKIMACRLVGVKFVESRWLDLIRDRVDTLQGYQP